MTSDTTIIFPYWKLPPLTHSWFSRPSEHMGGSQLALVAMWPLLANGLQVEMMCATVQPKCLTVVVALFSP